MRNKLLALMPEFQAISDRSLQETTLQVWLEAVKLSGWDIDDLHEMPFTLLIKNCSINIIEHTRAVTRCCLKIADVMLEEYKEKISLNRDYIIEHTRAVTRCCLKIADVMLEEYKEKISLNRDYLLSGALLHDVGPESLIFLRKYFILSRPILKKETACATRLSQ